MTVLKSIISGIIQGITEFLPISSSGHLVFLNKILNMPEPGMFFSICLHGGTLAAIIIYFRREVIEVLSGRNRKVLFYVAAGSLPIGVAAFFMEKKVVSFFSDPVKVSLMFFVTAALLFAGQVSLHAMTRPRKELSFKNTFMMGLSQAFSLLPGISRSGTTISTGLIMGVSAEKGFRFSFLLSIPAILGAIFYKATNLSGIEISAVDPVYYITGTVSAFAIGLLCLPVLWKAIKAEKLYIFGIYCVILGMVGIIFWR